MIGAMGERQAPDPEPLSPIVLLGRARLPLDAARRLVGPDCAYHLYFRHAASRPEPARRKRRSRG